LVDEIFVEVVSCHNRLKAEEVKTDVKKCNNLEAMSFGVTEEVLDAQFGFFIES